jgi:phage baseplate assembly protein gpV
MFNNMNALEQSDYTSYLHAKVVDNNDPLRKQRVRVSIPSLLVGNLEDLPWCSPILPAGFGHTPSAVAVSVPVVGSYVQVVFQQGELVYGLVVGAVHTADNTLPTELATNYPNRRGWKDPGTNVAYVDITEGSQELYVKIATGTVVKLTSNSLEVQTGSIHLKADSMNLEITNDLSISCSNLGITATTTSISGDTSVSNIGISGTIKQEGHTLGLDHVHTGVRGGRDNTQGVYLV